MQALPLKPESYSLNTGVVNRMIDMGEDARLFQNNWMQSLLSFELIRQFCFYRYSALVLQSSAYDASLWHAMIFLSQSRCIGER